MRPTGWKQILTFVLWVLVWQCGQAHAQVNSISSISPTSGPIGSAVVIAGLNFGSVQGTSRVSLQGTAAVVTTWSDTSITAIVPTGATSGTFSVVVNGASANSATFTITALPAGWSDGDVGSVGLAGSASYANGTFTVSGSGQGNQYTSSDEMNFAYQPLSGDGTIVARVLSATGTTTAQVGVMIRETLDADATMAYMDFENSSYSFDNFYYRATTGGVSQYQTIASGQNLPYWLEVNRSGSTFTAYTSLDGVNWVTAGSAETITMAQSVYIGLGVTSGTNSTLATATFDNVSVNSASAPAPVITNVSATTGPVGSQVVISGSGFGSTQGSNIVTLNDTLAPVNSWSAAAVTITIPTGATSGPLVVSIAPSMNDSNPFNFTVTAQPLPTSWLDQDVGQVGIAGTASYTSGIFTVSGSGQGIGSGSTDDMHFVYQPLSGDGTIVARVVSVQGSGYPQAGVIIRETLASNATMGYVDYDWQGYGYLFFHYRPSTGASSTYQSLGSVTNLPYWLELVRSGNTFTSYISPDGVNWQQTGTSESLTMAQNVYVGLAVSGDTNSSLATATFDNVSMSRLLLPLQSSRVFQPRLERSEARL